MPRRTPRPATGTRSRRGRGARSRAESGRVASLDYDDLLVRLRRRARRPRHGAAPPSGCGRGTTSSSSTSSRTPTRCSGRSSRPPSTAHADARAHRRPQAGDLRLPRRRRRRLPRRPRGRRPRRDARPQLAQRRRRCSPGSSTCSAAPRSATRGSSSVRSRPRSSDAGSPEDRRSGCVISRGRCSACRARSSTKPFVQAVREAIAADVAADVVRQLGTSRLRDGAGWRPVVPADIAVLARRNVDATTVRDALVAAGVPAVVSGLSSVFDSPAARAWLTLLVALEQPGNPGRTAAAALTPFVGWDATPARNRHRRRPRRAVRPGPVLGAAARHPRCGGALRGGGGRRARRTAPRHGHRRADAHRPAARRAVAAPHRDRGRPRGRSAHRLAAPPDRRGGPDYAEERSRRLETDAAAVQVVTVHASKGLEFPVVYVPFAWDRFESSTPPILRHHDGDDRVLDVGGPGTAGYDTARNLHMAEERGEDLRLLYVALTRACCQVVVHWAPSNNSAAGPLPRVLLGRPAPGEEPPPTVPVGRDDDAAQAFDALAASSGGTVAVEHLDAFPAPARWAPATASRAALAVAAFTRRLDTTWRRTSYTGAHRGRARVTLRGGSRRRRGPGRPRRGRPRRRTQRRRGLRRAADPRRGRRTAATGTGAARPRDRDRTGGRRPAAARRPARRSGVRRPGPRGARVRRHLRRRPRRRAAAALPRRGRRPLRRRRAGRPRGRARRGSRDPARSGGARSRAARRPARGPARRARVRAAARGRRQPDRRGRDGRRDRRPAAPSPAGRRPVPPVRGPPRGRTVRRDAAARLPHREPGRGPAGARPARRCGGPAIPGRGLQDEPARPRGGAADGRRTTAGRRSSRR